MTITLRSLQCFVSVVSAGSISKAADNLHIAQPALSLQIKNLENGLGVSLLNRSSKGVHPTAAGIKLMTHARDLLRRVDLAREDIMDSVSSPSGNVVLGLPQSIAKLLTVPLLRFCLLNWPDVHLQIIEASTGYIPGYVSSGHVDIGLTFSDDSTADLRFDHLINEELVLVSPPKRKEAAKSTAIPGIDQLNTIDFAAISELPLILPAGAHSLRKVLDRFQAERHAAFNVIAQVNAIPQLIELASAGIGHTILSFSSIRQEIAANRVSAQRISSPGMSRPVYLCRSDTMPLSIASMAVAEKISEILRADAAHVGN